MTSVTIPDTLTVIIPIIATLLSSFFRDNKLPQYKNALIALAAIVVIAVACTWLSGMWTSDMRALTNIILAFIVLLIVNEGRPILAWLFTLQSPLAPTTTTTTKYTTAPLSTGTTRTATVQRPGDRSGI